MAIVHVSNFGDGTGVDSIGTQNAINAANPGDTVQMSAGTGQWTSNVTISKAITLLGVSSPAPPSPSQGPGTSSTHIVRSSSWTLGSTGNAQISQAIIQIFPTTNGPITVGGLYLDNNLGPTTLDGNNYRICIRVGGAAQGTSGLPFSNIRITNCTFYTGDPGIFWNDNGGTYGLIDHCYFYNAAPGVELWGCFFNPDLGDSCWARADAQAGSMRFPFVEDCIFQLTQPYNNSPWVLYGYAGGRCVFRHNTVNDTNTSGGTDSVFDMHGNNNYYVAGTSNQRGTIRYEIYNNNLNLGRSYGRLADQRGGSLIFYNNTITTIDGSQPFGAARDEESEAGGGTPNMGQRAPVQWPCEDQVTASFFYGNTVNGVTGPENTTWLYDGSLGAPYIQQNRDWWSGPPNSGTTAVYPQPGPPSASNYPSPYAWMQTTSYAAAQYPHPLQGVTNTNPSFVQEVENQNTTSAVSTMNAPALGAQTGGDVNIVCVAWHQDGGGATSAIVLDTAGNSYFASGPVVTVTDTGTGAIRAQQVFIAKNIIGSIAGNVITVNLNSASNFLTIRGVEYTNINPVSPLDAISSNTGNSTTPSSGSLSTAFTGDILVAFLYGSGAPATITSGYTQRNVTYSSLIEDTLSGAPGPYVANATYASTTGWVMHLLALMPSGASGPAQISLLPDTVLTLNANFPLAANISILPSTIMSLFATTVHSAMVSFGSSTNLTLGAISSPPALESILLLAPSLFLPSGVTNVLENVILNLFSRDIHQSISNLQPQVLLGLNPGFAIEATNTLSPASLLTLLSQDKHRAITPIGESTFLFLNPSFGGLINVLAQYTENISTVLSLLSRDLHNSNFNPMPQAILGLNPTGLTVIGYLQANINVLSGISLSLAPSKFKNRVPHFPNNGIFPPGNRTHFLQL